MIEAFQPAPSAEVMREQLDDLLEHSPEGIVCETTCSRCQRLQSVAQALMSPFLVMIHGSTGLDGLPSGGPRSNDPYTWD